MSKEKLTFSLTPEDNSQLALLCDHQNENLNFIEKEFNIEIKNRGHHFTLVGPKKSIEQGQTILKALYELTQNETPLLKEELHLMSHSVKQKQTTSSEFSIHTQKGSIKPRNPHQKAYLDHIQQYDINFSIGPAGTGKTYLAVAAAIDALERDRVSRIVLVRPAVEAGERLGFLPGDMAQKVDPYLRPLYDALYEMMGFDRVGKLIEKQVIEIAPLAYMRGRTLNNAFIILDESQNTTVEQMKMFLTRIGFGSKAIITGDVTQIDLARDKRSGLLHVIEVLKNIKEISFTFFDSKDVVRHPLVQNIVEAYAEYEKHNG